MTDSTDSTSSKPIISYEFDYAMSKPADCVKCKEKIKYADLRVARIERLSKKDKKRDANHEWHHFSCFDVPNSLKFMPVEMIRGYSGLRHDDQDRVRCLLKEGVVKPASKPSDKDKQQKRAAFIKMAKKKESMNNTDVGNRKKASTIYESSRKRLKPSIEPPVKSAKVALLEAKEKSRLKGKKLLTKMRAAKKKEMKTSNPNHPPVPPQ